jgi:hypothetical protein
MTNFHFVLIREGAVSQDAQDAVTKARKRKETRRENTDRERNAQETFNWTQTKRFKLFWFYSRGGSSTLAVLVKSDADSPHPLSLPPYAFASIEFGTESQETHCYSLHGFMPKKLRSIYSPRCS